MNITVSAFRIPTTLAGCHTWGSYITKPVLLQP